MGTVKQQLNYMVTIWKVGMTEDELQHDSQEILNFQHFWILVILKERILVKTVNTKFTFLYDAMVCWCTKCSEFLQKILKSCTSNNQQNSSQNFCFCFFLENLK